ncbi:DoxX family protein [Thalassococcus profundi]|uniref:DoxX family protein n=1 Tax=Thalassococcus profundi TaxID=2282382 RepID=A0A369TNQ2_9RHOB|nr:DoxX family protein [Thalassococcus profundi]RDD66921.1 DoxX family protein [Thalassococcus profundi]
MQDLSALVGRVLIAALFVAGTVQKAVDPAAAQGLLAGMGLPVWLVWPATLFNAGAALALILGLWLRPVGYAAAFYCIVTSAFHFIPSDPWQMSIFVKNWAIAGGCLVLAAQGGGRYVMQATTEKTTTEKTGERA